MGLPANVWPKFEGEAPQWINFNAQEVKVEPVSRLEKYEVLNRSRHRQMEALIEARQHNHHNHKLTNQLRVALLCWLEALRNRVPGPVPLGRVRRSSPVITYSDGEEPLLVLV